MNKNLKLLLATLLILFVVTEIALRVVVHIYPGQKYYTQYFHTVDKLEVKRAFTADSSGIMKVDSAAAQIIANRIRAFYDSAKIFTIQHNESREVYDLVHHITDMEKPSFHSPLKSYVHSARFPFSDFDSAIAYYLRHPVNEYGFRSIPFRQYRSIKKKVLLVGDSFTWGHSASNIFSSFADNLLAMGYSVYNTGITCTDPVQYEQVAEKFVPLLRPDVVVMNVYLGNDVQYYSREPIPFAQQVYPANAGMMQTDFNGITVADPDSVYQIIADNLRIPIENSWFNKLCSLTSTGTLLWRVLAKLNLVNSSGERFQKVWKAAEKIKTVKPDVNLRAHMLQKFCDEYGAKLLVCVIRQMNGMGMLNNVTDFPGLFDSIPYYLSPIKNDGYQTGYDAHFNDLGHAQYAGFIDSLIRTAK